MTKINYREGLSNRQRFFVVICMLFVWFRYINFKRAIQDGQQPVWAYKWQIKL